MEASVTQVKTKAIKILRWVSFLPAAILAAWLAWLLINVLERIGFARYAIHPESFIAQFFCNTTGHSAMGVVFILVGARIAPEKQIAVAYILSGIGLAICGFSFFPAIMMGNGWAIWGCICVIFGICVTAYSIYKSDIDLNSKYNGF